MPIILFPHACIPLTVSMIGRAEPTVHSNLTCPPCFSASPKSSLNFAYSVQNGFLFASSMLAPRIFRTLDCACASRPARIACVCLRLPAQPEFFMYRAHRPCNVFRLYRKRHVQLGRALRDDADAYPLVAKRAEKLSGNPGRADHPLAYDRDHGDSVLVANPRYPVFRNLGLQGLLKRREG